MKIFLRIVALTLLFTGTQTSFGQVPTLGSTSNFVLFSTNGTLANTGTSALTGDIGTNNGTCTNFSGVIGTTHIMDAASALCASDLLALYNQLNTTAATLIPTTILGNGQVLTAGAYSLSAASSLNGTLTLNGQGNSNAVFIIQVQGAFSTNTNAEVILINGAKACRVFWQVEGLVTLGAGTVMKGTVIANNAAIAIAAGVNLEGRALTTTGVLSIDGSVAFTPTDCANPSPTITTQPVNQTACLGGTAIFSVTATGTALTYQWRIGTNNLVNGGNVSGATSAILTISSISATNVAANYNVVVTGSSAPSATSSNVSFALIGSPTITSVAATQTVCAGNAVSFPVTATGTGLTYQWRIGTVNLVNGGTISGATTSTLLISAATSTDASASYNVIVSGACAPSATSANMILVINALPLITVAPVSQTFCAGNAVSFPVTATGTGLTYQWRLGTVNLTNSGAVSGATSATLVISPVAAGHAGTNYNVVVSGACAPSATSANITIAVDGPPLITVAPVSQTVCTGNAVSFPVTATGTGLTYQWRIGTVNLVNGGTISGATSLTLAISAAALVDASANYNVIVSGVCAPSATSANISLAVNSLPAITTAPVSQTVCAGNAVSFSVTATGTGLTYQWRLGTVNLTNSGAISGVTSATLVINPVAATHAGTNYNVVVSGACAPSATSTNITLALNAPPLITVAPISQTVCTGNAVSFPVTATGTGLIYQWRIGTVSLVNGGTLSGATSATLLISAAALTDVSTNYNVIVSGVCAPSATSTNITLAVNSLPVITNAPVSQTVCAGNAVSFSVAATGTGLTYQWRIGTLNLVNGGTLSGATASNLLISAAVLADASANYNVIVSGACAPSATSANVTLAVNSLPLITTVPVSQTVCPGNTVSFPVTTTGTGLTYQWMLGAVNLTNGGAISGATSATLVINPVAASHAGANYNVVVSGACAPSATSTNITLAVNALPLITGAPVSQTVCAGDAVSFPVAATGTGLTYQWRIGTTNLVNGGTTSGATSATLVISQVNTTNASNQYNLVVSGVCTPSVASANVSLTVNTAPVITSQPVNQMADLGGSISFSVLASGTGLTYQWRKGTVNLTNSGTVSGANSSVLTINPAADADTSGSYNVIVSGSCSPADTSINVTLWVCGCLPTGLLELGSPNTNKTVTLYPNPFGPTLNMIINEASTLTNCELTLYTTSGTLVLSTPVTKQLTTIEALNLPPGTYVYRVASNNNTIQSGKLIAQ